MKKLILVALAFWSSVSFAGEIRIAAAADLKFALDEIIQQYQGAHPSEKVSATYGASGKFLTQIKENAPFDLFFSADTEKADEVVKAGKASGVSFLYAKGHLAVWVRNQSKIKPDPEMRCLLDAGVKKIAVANPKLAPYGTIAEEALKKSALYDQVSSKFVTGENIAQTAQFVESGAADVGLISKSLAMSPTLMKEGRFAEVSNEFYTPLNQSGVLLKTSNLAAAEKFKNYFMNADSKKILNRYGLTQ